MVLQIALILLSMKHYLFIYLTKVACPLNIIGRHMNTVVMFVNIVNI